MTSQMVLAPPADQAARPVGVSRHAILSRTASPLRRRWGQVRFAGATIDCLSFDTAVDAVCTLAAAPDVRHVVVTPNIHHIAELRRTPRLRSAYDRAALVFADGAPVVIALRAITGRRQERVTGADLLPSLCRAAAARGLTVGFVGGEPDSAARAAHALRRAYPGLQVSLVDPAPHGFMDDPVRLAGVLTRIRKANPDLLFVGLGSPKQEIFATEHAGELGSGVALCVGAAIDFASGARRRAPRVLQRWGLEWAWRCLQEPRRLAKRYATAAFVFTLVALPAVTTGVLRRVLRRWMRRSDPA
jgi:N-acetylglucosaminyldiphosphoundecaprenol N-acetyl-beta-D-mannosaminyltransferase